MKFQDSQVGESVQLSSACALQNVPVDPHYFSHFYLGAIFICLNLTCSPFKKNFCRFSEQAKVDMQLALPLKATSRGVKHKRSETQEE